MDPTVTAELQRLDPAVPFRATAAHRHHTWAETFYSRPELYVQPESVEEIQKIVTLARRCRRRIVVVGSGHSPSDLTCSSSWIVNLDNFSQIVRLDAEKGTVLVQAGIKVRDFNAQVEEYGLTMRNIGSIDDQSIAGAFGTATHGSSMKHGLLSESAKALRLVLANGSAVWCSAKQNPDLFRAALVSLGAIGILVEIEFELIRARNIEWTTNVQMIPSILDRWEEELWSSAEYTRIWWLPYVNKAVIWRADKTEKPESPPVPSWYFGAIGYHAYQIMLLIANYIPWIMPTVERVISRAQHGTKVGVESSGVVRMREGLLLDCMYSQFVNEWGIPLHKGAEALRRITAWINHDQETARIPVDCSGVYVHSPIEVRVSDSSPQRQRSQPRPFMDFSVPDGPTLWLNALAYRPYGMDPPGVTRFYAAFEHLMLELGGRPHWAKNFQHTDRKLIEQMYGDDLVAFRRVRNEVDPDGMFVGEWHRRTILPSVSEMPLMALEEREVSREALKSKGGRLWVGEQAVSSSRKGERMSHSSQESFDMLYAAEVEASTLLKASESETGTDDGAQGS